MYSHEIKIRVRYGETDKMGYVYYGNYPEYYEVGRTELLRSLGFTYRQLEDLGILMPIVEMNIQYFRPSFYDDEINLMKYENAENDVFETYPEWEKLKLEALAEKNASFLHISSSNPELLKNVNPERVANYSKVSNIALKKYLLSIIVGMIDL